ncbi:hypothetical protein SESBI_36880 [Sesbania bispinosa]|nr:hypothetical protein SESBI_36880 [Sesbania bispinosa]
MQLRDNPDEDQGRLIQNAFLKGNCCNLAVNEAQSYPDNLLGLQSCHDHGLGMNQAQSQTPNVDCEASIEGNGPVQLRDKVVDIGPNSGESGSAHVGPLVDVPFESGSCPHQMVIGLNSCESRSAHVGPLLDGLIESGSCPHQVAVPAAAGPCLPMPVRIETGSPASVGPCVRVDVPGSKLVGRVANQFETAAESPLLQAVNIAPEVNSRGELGKQVSYEEMGKDTASCEEVESKDFQPHCPVNLDEPIPSREIPMEVTELNRQRSGGEGQRRKKL